MTPRSTVIGSSNSISTSTIESLPRRNASKLTTPTANEIIPRRSNIRKLELLSTRERSFQTNGVIPAAPKSPIQASVSTSPIFRVLFWIKKSPNPQQIIAPIAANIGIEANIYLYFVAFRSQNFFQMFFFYQLIQNLFYCFHTFKIVNRKCNGGRVFLFQ